jgi:hypothetical protein
METDNNLIKVFAGPEATAIILKERLEEIGIDALIKNDTSSAFFGGHTHVIDLFINESDLKEAKPLIEEFTGK